MTHLSAERFAEALWDYREQRDPSGPRTGCTEDDDSREQVPWAKAVEDDLWPGSRREAMQEAEAVLHMLGLLDAEVVE